MKKSFMPILMLVCFFVATSFNVSFAAKKTEETSGQKLETASVKTVEEEKEKEFTLSDIPEATPQLKQKAVELDDKNITSSPSIINMKGRASEFSFSGTIANQGQFAWVYPIGLANGQIVQARMECPSNKNLDFDLYLYEFDSATGDLVGNALAISAYKTYFNTTSDGTSKTLDEALGYVNTSGTAKNYAVGVYARTGGNTTDQFKLNISLDGPKANADGSIFWPYELNESQNAANTFGTINTNSSIAGGKINSLNDNDWFELRTPSDFTLYAQYLKVDMLENQAGSTTPNAQCTSELYYTNDGESMILVPKNSAGKYLVESNGLGDNGVYYVRIMPNSSFSGYAEYALKTSHEKLPATQIRITEFDSIAGTNNFETLPGYGRGYWLPYNAKYVTIRGCLANKKGVAVPGQYGNVKASHRTGGWTQWPDDDPYLGKKYSIETPIKNDGTYEVTVENLPPPEGKHHTNGSVYTSTFDIDTVNVWLVNNPSTTVSGSFYHGADAY